MPYYLVKQAEGPVKDRKIGEKFLSEKRLEIAEREGWVESIAYPLTVKSIRFLNTTRQLKD